MSLAPAPQNPERSPNVYERKVSSAMPGERGPLRFQEGVGTDTDVPNEFSNGALQGYVTPPGRPNHNKPVHTKTAEETLRERAHVGSAAWVESTQFLQEFAGGSFSDYAEPRYEQVTRSGGHYMRANPASVND